MVSQRPNKSKVTHQQRQAEREKRREERKLERQESGGHTAGAEVLGIVEGFSTSVFDLVEDIMKFAREQRAKNRQEGRVAPKQDV